MAARRTIVSQLHELRSAYSSSATAAKLSLLVDIRSARIGTIAGLKRLHQTLCYLSAFPDTAEVHSFAAQLLDAFEARLASLPRKIRDQFDDTGFAGSNINYRYSLDVARWLVKHYPGAVEIDWTEFEESTSMDEILSLIIAPAEDTAFSEGEYTTLDWLNVARGDSTESDFDWLIQRIAAEPRLRVFGRDLFDEADVPVTWKLGTGDGSISRNRVALTSVHFRTGMRRLPKKPMTLIAEPLKGIRRLSPADGRTVIHAAMAALAARHREVFSMNVADPAEVWLAPLGEGVHLAVFGVERASRPVMEGNYGYLLLSNGVPIGYGGVSPLFSQGNTGINIFEEYRKSEAAFLFAQSLRAFRTLFGCEHFIANPYQIGAGNAEAIGSGAFWFYYRFGFRPVDGATRQLAAREYKKLASRREYRSDRKTLSALAKGDLVLTLPGAKRSSFFPERWLVTISEGATRLIAAQDAKTRVQAVRRIVQDVADQLGVRGSAGWPKGERIGFDWLSPIAGLINDLADWSATEKRRLVELMRAKGADDGRCYAQLLGRHDRFRCSLTAYCRKQDRVKS